MDEGAGRPLSDSRASPRRVNSGLILVLAVLLIVCSAAYAFIALKELVDASDDVEHAQTVLVQIADLNAALVDAETGERGFVATGEARFLLPYEAALAALPERLATLRRTLGAEPAQTLRLNRLQAQIDLHLAGLARGIAARRAGSDPGEDLAKLGAGKTVMDEIRLILGEMRAEEQARYGERTGTASLHALRAQIVLVTATLASLVTLLIVFSLVRREARQRREAELSLQATNAALEAHVRERTEAIASRERFLVAVIDGMRDAVLVALDGRILFANRACLDLFKAEGLEQLIDRPLAEIAAADFRESADRRLDLLNAGDTGLPPAAERVRRFDGSEVDVEISATSFNARGGRAVMLMLRDISALKATELQLRQAQKMEAVGQLTGGIAHDFNNILTVIVGNLDAIAEELAGRQRIAAMADAALQASLRGAEMTRRLLAFARRQTLAPRHFVLNERIPSLVAVLQRTLGEQIRVTTALAPGLWPARADPSQVDDALVNLGINARDAMPKGGDLTIETANVHLDDAYAAANPEVTPGDYVMLAVSDTGAGMTPEVAERALEPFFTTKPPGQGTGLGLSMIYGFARQSGGHLKIYTEAGLGTTVKLYLPRSDQVDLAATAPVGVVLPRGSESILLVEDNADVREMAERQLRELGYRVRSADSGPAALALIAAESFDLLFTDIVMPGGMTGYELAAAARARRPGLRVLFTTGYARVPLPIEEGRTEEAILRKPYRRSELALRVREVLNTGRD